MRKLFRSIHAAAFLAALTLSTSLAAQTPSTPVRIVVPFSAAGVTDLVARMLAEKLSKEWQRPVIVENKPGAGGNIGAEYVSRAPTDGSVFLLAGTSIVINSALQENVPYELMKTVVPVSLLADLPFLIVVSPSLPVQSLRELVEHSRSHPGVLNFGSGGTGTTPHVAGEQFKQATNTDIVHVPFKGAAPATTELVAGRIQLMIDSAQGLAPLVESGKLKALATPREKRIDQLPSVPTTSEAGIPGFEVSSWLSLWAPGGTPREIIDSVSADIARILKDPEIRQKLEQQVIEPVGSTPAEFEAVVNAELAKWTEVIQRAGITTQ